ncbi:MAG: hypothetical protein KatS3mg132_158 [Limisphaera sp.]|nr:MAG: hypothetical protein KatS3mg132_158 [Limisphaera sp.]
MLGKPGMRVVGTVTCDARAAFCNFDRSGGSIPDEDAS